MSLTKPFYPHESDNKIMVKKDRTEVGNWTNDLEYINEELEQLMDIENRILHSSDLYGQLHAIRRENTLRLGNLYRYENSIRNAMECDTTECDAYYLNNHERHRNTYREHLEKYRMLKSKVLSKIVLTVKKK
tara:strand:+ start:12567 stop:12962 length:396 start_codon:yes stop_codon:yes gene_type:complete